MLLIYTQKVTPRITYVFKHICTHILEIPIKFTSKIEEFIAHEGAKLSYGKQALGQEFFIQKVELLMEQGFSELEIKVQPWEETICFFPVSESSDLPFDIFAAAFYLLSRYEEYLPHVKDEEGRFPASESLGIQESFLHKPVVDIWALKFRDVLRERFPKLKKSRRKYKVSTIITVEHTFIYKNKGILRSFIGFHLDLLKLNFNKVGDRVKVWIKMKKDPYDAFEKLIELIKQHKLYMLFMFQVSDFSIHDRNISHNRIPHRAIIKSVADYAKVGLLMGYYSMEDIKVLRREKLRMEEIVHSSLEHSMNAHYDQKLPDHFNDLIELEILNDYSMGYQDVIGFRAGTCTPFLFYDINLEVTTPLKLHPYGFNSEALNNATKSKVKEDLHRIISEVKEVKGNLNAVFKNQNFSIYEDQETYYSLLKELNGIE